MSADELTFGDRKHLPPRRRTERVKYRIDETRWPLYVDASEYPDGTLGELFLSMGREGDFTCGMLDAFAQAVSIGLQHGVPLETYVGAFKGLTFRPSGSVQGAEVGRTCTSVLDLVFTDLASKYLTGAAPTSP